jgi:hypothetical protein
MEVQGLSLAFPWAVLVRFKVTAVWWAARMGHTAVLKLLLERGADFDVEDWRGRSPLAMARHKRHPGCVALLEVGGSGPRTSTGRRGRRAQA